MTVVYMDSLLLLNFAVNYLLLLASARLAGEGIRRLRLAAGAALGAAYAGAVFLPGCMFLSHPVCKVAAAVGMVLCAFGGSVRLVRTALVFLGVTAAFGGGIFAIELLGGQGLTLRSAVFYSAMDLRLILLSAALCYVAISLVFQRGARHAVRGELVGAVLDMGGRKASLTALVDTGNTLTDPVTNRPVMVAEGRAVSALFCPGRCPAPEDLRHPADSLERLSVGAERGRYRLLPYRAVGVECGMLLAVRVDRARIGTEEYGNILVALSPTPVSDGGGYQALIGA